MPLSNPNLYHPYDNKLDQRAASAANIPTAAKDAAVAAAALRLDDAEALSVGVGEIVEVMAVVCPLEVVVTTVCDGVAVFPPWTMAVTASVSVSVSPSSSTDVIVVV
jgi:hypothetical protein